LQLEGESVRKLYSGYHVEVLDFLDEHGG